MQNAPECQDPVTTRQDRGQTCWDVFAKVKPSLMCPARPRVDVDKRLPALLVVRLAVISEDRVGGMRNALRTLRVTSRIGGLWREERDARAEDLLNEVRDRESRRYLEEAIRAYDVGAFRVAIVATWVAVAFDLIAKIRQLAAGGDAGGNDFIRTLDQAIEGDSPNRLLGIERNLLTVAHETFEFIEHRELKELERLRVDRHVCAHPAFVRPTEVFEPPPELVRAHVATAVDAVLSKGPTPGRRAIERFKEEIKRGCWISRTTLPGTCAPGTSSRARARCVAGWPR